MQVDGTPGSILLAPTLCRGPTEDNILYFSIMSPELHYLDIVPKIEIITLMSSASGENHLSNTYLL